MDRRVIYYICSFNSCKLLYISIDWRKLGRISSDPPSCSDLPRAFTSHYTHIVYGISLFAGSNKKNVKPPVVREGICCICFIHHADTLSTEGSMFLLHYGFILQYQILFIVLLLVFD